MADRDPLQEHFEAFRSYSVRAAQPPGVSSIRLAVRRRRAARSVVGVATVVLLALVLVPSWRPDRQRPAPVTSVTPAPTSSASGAPPSSPAVTGSSGQPTGVPGSGAGSSAAAQPASCATPANGVPTHGEFLINGFTLTGGTVRVDPPTFFDRCPDYRLRFIEAVYGWSVDRQQIVLVRTVEHHLTRAKPSVTVPRWTSPANVGKCGEAYVVLQTTRPAPATIPASVQNGGVSAFHDYVQKAAYALPPYWSFLSHAGQVAIAECGPPASPPAG